MGAKDREPRRSRYRGLSVVVLYNTARPHSSLGYQTPASFAGTLAAIGSSAALPQGHAPTPIAQPAPHGVMDAEALIAVG